MRGRCDRCNKKIEHTPYILQGSNKYYNLCSDCYKDYLKQVDAYIEKYRGVEQ